MLFAKKAYDRKGTLDAAEKARAKGKKAKAISEYRKILANEPDDKIIHGKVAPLLAETNQLADAWKSFVLAAQGQVEAGFLDRGIAIYTQAANYFPRSPEVWETIAKLHFDRGRKGDSIKALLTGQAHFHKKKKDWPNAIRLLRNVVKIDEHNVPGTIALAKLLKKTGEKAEAAALLDKLAPNIGGTGKQKVLKARFWIAPTFGGFFRWLFGRK